MAEVNLGRTGSAALVGVDVCVKTGRPTAHRVTLRGHTMPAWVTFLMFFSVIGFLIAGGMTSRRYRVTLPFAHAAHDRWRSNRRWAWLVGLAGVAALVSAATIGHGHAGLLVGTGIALVAGSAVIGTSNAMTNNVGVRTTQDGELVVTRAHPAFAEAVRAGAQELLSSR